MPDHKQSRGPESARNNPARPVSEGDDAFDHRGILQALLAKHRLRVAEVRKLTHAYQLRTIEGPIINIFATGTVQLQGQRTHLAREFAEELRTEIAKLIISRGGSPP